MKPVAILGAGAFGTALAIAMARPGRPVLLWCRDPAHAATMQRARKNAGYLPGIPFPPSLRVIGDIREIPMSAVQILAVPAQQTGPMLEHLGPDLPDAPMVLAAKGMDLKTGALQSETVAALRARARVAVLSGPGFAVEIARGLPTALTLAAADEVLSLQLQERLSTPDIRLYRSGDPVGVQIAGSLKNVIAIACGVAHGAGLGDSARAALMTRGYAEMVRLGTALGAQAATFTGLAGLGDLALTCGSLHSRNYAAGVAIGKGKDPASGTIEGIATCEAVMRLASRHAVDMPVSTATAAILAGGLSIREAMAGLLARPLRDEG